MISDQSVMLYLAYAWNSGDGQTYVGISTIDADRQHPATLKDRLPFGGARGEVFSGGSGGEPPREIKLVTLSFTKWVL